MTISATMVIWAQFLQYSMYSFYACRSKKRKKTLMTYVFTFLGSTRAKAVHRMLMKLTPGLNFINVLRTAFTLVDTERVIIQSNPQYLFMHLGSTCAKAVRRTLVKLTPDRQQSQ